MKSTTLLLVAAVAAATFNLSYPPQALAATEAFTTPVGYVNVTVQAGTGLAKRNTLISLPLLGSDDLSAPLGTVSQVKDATTLVVTPSGTLAPGVLSNPATPYVLQFTSGAADGQMLVIATSPANTGTEISFSNQYGIVDLAAMGVFSSVRIS